MDLKAAIPPGERVVEFSRKHRTGLLTLLFTDIVGSTQLKQNLGDREGIARIQRHHALVRELLAAFREAEEIETAGDSFFIIFAKPSEAVKFALLLQSRLSGLVQAVDGPVFDRIGIHVGEVHIAEGGDTTKPKSLYGIQVDTCARVMSLAGAGRILMTRFAFDSARQVLRGGDLEGLGELQWMSHGPYLFKGVEEPIEVCEVRMESQGSAAAPPSTEKARRYAGAEEEAVLGWRPAVGLLTPGTHWVLDAKLGEGGFGEVWLVRHRKLKEERVFKFCFRADRVRALKREMTLFRVLRERVGEQRHIVKLLDINLEQPPYYLEEEYVNGRDLRTWCAAQGGINQVPLETRLDLVAQAAEGLAAAHAAGILHRDIKPGNILVSSQKAEGGSPAYAQVKLTDFGIGQVISAEYLAGVTATGMTGTILAHSSSQTGTQMYMAPEVLAGRAATVQADIYSLGMVLYQLVAGDFTRPVTTDWARDIGDPLLKEELQRCFAGDLTERFGQADDLARQLRTLTERRGVLAQRQAAERAAVRPATGPLASMAVLPFANMSSDPENEYLSDGIAEDLLSALSRVPGLRVPGRTSCFAFKGKTQDLRMIGQMLGVETVLEGSVRKAGNRLRITAQLINVADGFHLWSERYDREMADVFAIQDEITQAIMAALKIKLQPTILVRPGTGNIEAYELCLRGRYNYQKWTPDGLALAIHFFEQALERDQDNPVALVGLAFVRAQLCYFGGLPPREVISADKAAILRALATDDTVSVVHARWADFLYFYDWDWAGAAREFQRALELDPKNLDAHTRYGYFLWARLHYEEALAEIQKALEGDPFSPEANWWLCWVLLSLERYNDALDQARKMVAMDPNFWGGHMMSASARSLKGMHAEAIQDGEKMVALEQGPSSHALLCHLYMRAGRSSEAREVLERIVQMARQRLVPPVWLAYAYEVVGEKEQARACLERAIAENDLALVHLRAWAKWFPGLFADCQDLLEKSVYKSIAFVVAESD